MQYLIIITVSAVIGYVTNKIALKMLFRPKRPVLGFQAIMIKRKRALAESIADLIIDRLLSNELENSGESMLNNISDAAATELSELLRQDLELPDSDRDKIKSMLAGEIKGLCKGASVASHVSELKASLINNIAAIPDDEIESVTLAIVNNEFATIEKLGAVLGAVIGGVSCLGLF